MPGGEKSIEEISRMGVSYLLAAYGSSEKIPSFSFIERVGRRKVSLFEEMIEKGLNTPYTSSCGRLFDAVSSLIGLCDTPSYDAQGAILLEHAAGSCE
jgi:hydrogenase maturation protein HypF